MKTSSSHKEHPTQAKKRTDRPGNKHDHVDVLDTNGKEVKVSAFGAKKGISKAAFCLQYHNSDDYKKLSKEQKDKLCQQRSRTGQGKGKGNKPDAQKKLPYDKEKPSHWM